MQRRGRRGAGMDLFKKAVCFLIILFVTWLGGLAFLIVTDVIDDFVDFISDLIKRHRRK